MIAKEILEKVNHDIAKQLAIIQRATSQGLTIINPNDGITTKFWMALRQHTAISQSCTDTTRVTQAMAASDAEALMQPNHMGDLLNTSTGFNATGPPVLSKGAGKVIHDQIV